MTKKTAFVLRFALISELLDAIKSGDKDLASVLTIALLDFGEDLGITDINALLDLSEGF